MAGLLYDALELAVVRYNTAKGTNYKYSDFTFEDPIDLRQWGISHPSGRNTMVKAQVDDKRVNLTYDRLDLNTHYVRDAGFMGANGVGGIFLESDAIDKSAAAGVLGRALGIPLAPRDLVKEDFDWAALRTNTSVNLVFTIAPTSYNYLPGSSFTVQIGGSYLLHNGKVLRIYDTALELEAFHEDYVFQSTPKVDPNNAVMSGHQTCFNDYTRAARQLKRLGGYETYRAGDPLGVTGDPGAFILGLCTALKACDGNPWVWTASTPVPDFNLYKAWVVYNGPVEYCTREFAQQYRIPAQYLPLHAIGNSDFDNVCLIWPASTGGQTQSVYVLHYNDYKGAV